MTLGPPAVDRPPDETLDELYENAPCGYASVDAGGAIVRANATLLAWLGSSREALLGQPIRSILTPAGRVFFETHVAQALGADGAAPQVAVDLACADGRRLPVLTDWRRVVHEGRTLGLRVMLVDASDRRAYERDLIAEREHAQEAAARLRESEAKLRELNETLERRVAERSAELETAYEQLRQSQKLEAMGSLTGGVAHDFNNLLTPILGGLDMLQRRGLEDARAPRIIAGALASAERAKTLVHRLLAFARRQPLRPVAVDLADLVLGMRDLLITTLGPQVRLDLEMEPDLPHALADANQIEMALLNLAVNARDAMPGGGALTIAARRQAPPADLVSAPGDFLRLSVIDTGVGMDAATLARAVEPFFSTKGAGHGTGLGLSMVHGLAEQLGGKLRLESRPGQGARVDLWLPVAEAPALGDPAPAPAVGHLASGAVLLVDDEALVRAATADMLVDLGYRVVQAASAADALSMLEDGFEPDLLVTDHLMPGMSGTDLARQILTERDLPVLIVSGYADVDAIAPDIARLSKPFRRDDLAAALVAARSSRREPGAHRAAS